MIYLYKCEKCEQEVEIECKLDEKDTLPCPNCKAPPEKLKQLINANFPVHGSWSTWRV